ncbi:hypothetical protein [Acetobacter orientalis]|uniref:Uncharacterized protein n=1 Tax=Acetobacter orientalis TaxID=146474 RepID=A0A0D6NMN7_9PROT|nr:hypothetical protein [Acetobacter orientalis]GAN66878.1 hypothetical protein Abor_031_044 [Acetobacter orientalis]GBR14372.1 hypothetical protein AA0481_0595 [Acetobacter orientalis NRIC 0481]GEL60877.1 hypothetical protein AOR02nite_07190 [Acetobacter orientalis]
MSAIKPPHGFKLAYARDLKSSEWAKFGTQARAPEFLKQCAYADPNNIRVIERDGRECIFVRAK